MTESLISFGARDPIFVHDNLTKWVRYKDVLPGREVGVPPWRAGRADLSLRTWVLPAVPAIVVATAMVIRQGSAQHPAYNAS